MKGTPFGRYQLITILGRGGMGDVWRAFDTVTERMVAIKVLPGQYGGDETYQKRFRREAKAAAGLNDPHVVPIYDFGEIGGRLFVTMRLVEGEDLQEIIGHGPLPPGRAVGIVEQIAGALHAAHRIDLVHRDVKPHNILVTEDDFAYLIDFGIARAAGETGLTSAGATIGTWAYMAPERFQTGLADARADIYALTVVLYQALTGQLPFPAISVEQIALAHVMTTPPAPSAVRDDLPPAMDAIIATGMAKNPGQRYATTKDLATAARNALASAAAPTVNLVPLPAQPRTTRAPAVRADPENTMFNAPRSDPENTMFSVPPSPRPTHPYRTPSPRHASADAPTHQGVPAPVLPAAPASPAPLAPPGASDDRNAAPASRGDGRNKAAIIALAATVGALLLVGIGLFAFTSVFDGGTAPTASDTTTEPETNASETNASETSAEATTSKPPGEGAVTEGDFTFSVASTDSGDTVASPTDNSVKKTASGQFFFVVYLTVGNTGSSEATFPGTLAVLNADGNAFSPDEEASGFLGGGSVTVKPGGQVEVPVAFDVPVGTAPTSIQVHGVEGGEGVEVPL
jgi:serine/threonine protein kinase